MTEVLNIDPAAVGDSELGNHDLNPTPESGRTWTWVDYTALWVGMAHNIPTWMMAGGMIALGMSWWMTILIIAAGNLIVLAPIILNSHPGTKFGIPFPIVIRASFGIRGANIATIVRGAIAAIWFGIQVHIGGQALELILARLSPAIEDLNKTQILFQGVVSWVCFLVFLVTNLWILKHGMGTLRKFERWAAPSVLILAMILFIWAWQKAGGFGPIFEDPQPKPPADLGNQVLKSLMGVIGFWATLSLNASDFTRFAKSQRDQVIGQTLGLPTTMIVFSLLGVLTSSATALIFGKVIWDPVALVEKLPSTLLAVVCLFAIIVATLSVNVAANLVSAAYDISNLAPRKLSFWHGAIIAGILGTIILPWQLLANPKIFIFDWLGTTSIALGPVAGILFADYWWVRKCRLNVAALYDPNGKYAYSYGVNPKAVVAAALGVFCAYSGLIWPSLRILTDMGWITGSAVSLLSYKLMMGTVDEAVA